MITVSVTVSHPYEVYIGSGLLAAVGPWIRSHTKARKACIVSDSHVWPLYGDQVTNSFASADISAFSHVIPAGESSKNGINYLNLLNDLAEHKLTRTDCIIALGGGVVGDLAGFAAATYLRGIPYVQLPTTLLAAVDSSVGGKTAIDLEAGKNLAGAFYQPIAVFCDTDTLSTLPEAVFRDGCAEVIKYGVLFDPELFDFLCTNGLNFHREPVIARCVELKRDVVTVDEFDRGERMKLNLGHTIGHGIEACSNYEISHGTAVAIGMAIVARASQCQDRQRILDCLSQFGLPVSTEFTAQMLLQAALSDKKRNADTIHLIIPFAIGDCRIVSTPVSELESLIQAGL